MTNRVHRTELLVAPSALRHSVVGMGESMRLIEWPGSAED
jgi:hypothetical protein